MEHTYTPYTDGYVPGYCTTVRRTKACFPANTSLCGITGGMKVPSKIWTVIEWYKNSYIRKWRNRVNHPTPI